MSRWITHKFGGSSLADAERIARVADLLHQRREAAQAVVVSAMAGVTNALIELTEQAIRGTDVQSALAALRERHSAAAAALLGERAERWRLRFDQHLVELAQVLRTLKLLCDGPPAAREWIAGLGEVWSAELLTAHFHARGLPARFLDAREVLVVERGELGVAVDWPHSRRRLEAWLGSDHPPERLVITGFVARDRAGRPTTLGRNGSDYSGAIFGALLDAVEVQIWTDVDGVLSADPRLVPEAHVVPRLSYAEAYELAYFGAKVIHPQTMTPVAERGIPLVIRNTFAPEHPGTRIDRDGAAEPPIKGVTAVPGQALVTVEGAGMIGVPGTAERVFGALRSAGVSVVMISQGSSEHSICCVVRGDQAELAARALEEHFQRERAQGAIGAIAVEAGIAVLAVVGDGMAGRPGTAARLFTALGRAGINVRAIAQGSSERNISIALAERESARALRAVHAGFYLSAQTLSIGLIGPGHVGRALLRQLHAAQARLAEAGIDLRLRALANSRRMCTDPQGLPWARALDALAAATTPTDLDALADAVRAEPLPHAAIIDLSASDQVAERYAGWLGRGIHVITANKHAGAGPAARYQAIRRQGRQARFYYEATVGAGLPIINTLRDLLDTGDRLLSIEGSLSGTLGYLFAHFDGTRAFSSLLHEAHRLGYTEPDPREDLSGRDVARKLVILAREAGQVLELDEVRVESLVPPSLAALTPAEFLAAAAQLDDDLERRRREAARDGGALRYVARYVPGASAEVALRVLPLDDPLARARPTDNVVRFRTERYDANPLVVQGPGAGPEVTAAGVFADLLRLTQMLGGRP